MRSGVFNQFFTCLECWITSEVRLHNLLVNVNYYFMLVDWCWAQGFVCMKLLFPLYHESHNCKWQQAEKEEGRKLCILAVGVLVVQRLSSRCFLSSSFPSFSSDLFSLCSFVGSYLHSLDRHCDVDSLCETECSESTIDCSAFSTFTSSEMYTSSLFEP